MKFYSDWAMGIVNGQWTDFRAFYGLPGYAFFLAAIFSLTGLDPFTVGLIQCVAEAGTAVLILKISRCVFQPPPGESSDASREGDRRPLLIGCLAAAGWITFPPAQTYSAILMPTAWLVLAFWFCVWRILQINHASRLHPWFALGLLAGVTSMMVATILFLLPLFLVAIWIYIGREQRDWPTAAVKTCGGSCALLTGVLLGLSPCAIHNYLLAREPVLLSAHSGINFWIGNNPKANGYPRIPAGLRSSQEGLLKDSVSMAEAEAGRPLKRFEVSRHWSAKTHAYIRENPREWARLIATKVRNFWNTFRYDDISSLTVFRQGGLLLPGLSFGLVAAFALPGMVIAARRFRQSRWVSAAVILHMLALLPVFVTERYRLAAVPGLLLMAAFCAVAIWESLKRSKWLFSGATAVACVGAAWFTSLPLADTNLWSVDFYNAGLRAMETDNLPLAEKNLRTAYAYVQTNAEINFVLGNLAYKKGHTAEAKRWFQAALQVDPWHPGVWNNLGVLALEEQRWDLAESFLQHSLAREPVDAKTFYLLARARLGAGDPVRAAEAAQRALELRPGQPEMKRLADEIALRMR